VIYPARYRDKSGEETTSISNDGEVLRMDLRGVGFVGRMLDDWEPVEPIAPDIAARFTFDFDQLSDYALRFAIPVPVMQGDQTLQGLLDVHLELGRVVNGRFDHERLGITLKTGDRTYAARQNQGWFDDALCELRDLLPIGVFIKCCHSCAYSDYSPAGYGVFGGLACFRNCKQEYLALKGKRAFFSLVNRMDRYVQETYLCAEFEKRAPGTGYRG